VATILWGLLSLSIEAPPPPQAMPKHVKKINTADCRIVDSILNVNKLESWFFESPNALNLQVFFQNLVR
jgi:hypothetical protein